MKKIILGIIGLTFFCIISLIIFYVKPLSIYPVFYGFGIFFFIICLLNAVLDSLYYHLNRSASTEVYQKLAYTDIMTHLENRSAFIHYQKNAIPQENQGCIVFDINNLKLINDSRGHLKGDPLIIHAAKCIQDVFEKIGQCYRIGRDEFVVILENVSEKVILKS